MKVCLGPIPIASGNWYLRNGLRANGIEAEVWTAEPHRFGYPQDGVIQTPDDVARLLAEFDGFHGLFGQTLVHESLPAYRAQGKRFFVTLNGCDVRSIPGMERQGRPSIVCNYCDQRATCHHDAKMTQLWWLLEHMDALWCDIGVLDCVEPLAAKVGRAVTPYPQPIDLADFPVRAPVPDRLRSEADPWIIVHAPSSRAKKGTAFVVAAIEALQRDGAPVRLDCVEGTQAQVRAALHRADLVVDQLLIGWYGTFAVEAMALGVPTLCYLHPWYLDRMGWVLPAMHVTKETLAGRIRAVLQDGDARTALGRQGRAHVERHHDTVRLCRDWAPLYDPARESAGVV